MSDKEGATVVQVWAINKGTGDNTLLAIFPSEPQGVQEAERLAEAFCQILPNLGYGYATRKIAH